MMHNDAGLSVRNATVVYDDEATATHGLRHRATPKKVAVANVSFDLAPGESLALLGPSGCGKSSLLRAVAGLEPLAAGTVYFDGQDLARVPAYQRNIGLLFQDGQLFPHRNVERNVAYGLEMQHLPRAQRKVRVGQLLELVGLPGYQKRPINTLSGGERQRVALARALAPNPRLMLLDEPFSALDRSLRGRLAVEVRDILKRTGIPSITVTHDHDEAFTMADRVGIMRDGQILALGTESELRASANPGVQSFLSAP
jgi:thiamine transport system ATP-binding protein